MEDSKTVRDYTERMLTDGDVVEKYAEAARLYNLMAEAGRFVGVPATLHDALYKTRHGEQDLRTAVQVLNDMMREVADGLVTLMLVCRLRKEAWKEEGHGGLCAVGGPCAKPGCKGFKEQVEDDPLRHCPKCGAMPLADDGKSKVLCESCNQWYDVETRQPCRDPGDPIITHLEPKP